MSSVREALAAMGLPRGDLHDLPDSAKRFPDGAQYRVEIPSTEGPACLAAVLHEAERLEVRVHRVSQGSGVFMLTDAELDEVAALGCSASVEVSLFAHPNAGWNVDDGGRARRRRGRRGRARAGAAGRGARRRVARRRARNPERTPGRPRRVGGVRCPPPGRRAPLGHAGQDVGDAADRQPGDRARARAFGRVDAQRDARSVAGPDRGDSQPPSIVRSTSTSRSPATSAASFACTRSRTSSG